MTGSASAESALREAVRNGTATVGIELGSTRIKASLVGDDLAEVLASGSHEWENRLVDGLWTYPLDEVWTGLQAAVAALSADVRARSGEPLTRLRALGISAMMHGYLAFDRDGGQLAGFRTWRNTNTARASAELSDAFGVNIPLRWSVAHLRQAVLDAESHVSRIHHLTTLAGYVHERLTGRRVLGVGDASGMFPIDSATHDYDAELLARFDALEPAAPASLRELLPEVLVAGEEAGVLTAEGAALLDPSGTLEPGAILCPPEGDAGTGMVATDAIAPRTGNVSAGTSIFAMIVLERPLSRPHDELDLVTTPAGDPVAMVHCNNGASELGAWVGVFRRFAEAAGSPVDADAAYAALFREALAGDADAGGVLAYNQVAGEPVLGLDDGRPLVARTPDSRLTLGNLMRAQLYGTFAALGIGMRVLDDEGARVDVMNAHGGIFRTAGVAQRLLAAALGVPVAVTERAAEGGAWGVAVLAAFTAARRSGEGVGELASFLRDHVVRGDAPAPVNPDPVDASGYAAYLERYRAGLELERAAASALLSIPPPTLKDPS